MRASFQFTCDPPTAWVTIDGELDLSTGDRLADLFSCVASRACTLIELDLGGVTFIDAYTLSLIHQEQRRLRAMDGDLRVVAASACCELVSRLAEYDSLRPVTGHPPRLRVMRTRRLAAGE